VIFALETYLTRNGGFIAPNEGLAHETAVTQERIFMRRSAAYILLDSGLPLTPN